MGRKIKRGGIKPISASISSETRELLEKYKEGTITQTIEKALRYYFWDKTINSEDKEKATVAMNIRKYKQELAELNEQQEQVAVKMKEAASLYQLWLSEGKKLGLSSKLWGDGK